MQKKGYKSNPCVIVKLTFFIIKKSPFSALKIVPFSESAFKLLGMLNRTLFLILLTLAVNF